MNGIEKRIDNLGRIVLPMSFRKKLGLKKQDIVVVSLKESTISIVPFGTQCALCGKILESDNKKRLCPLCISKVKKDY